MKKPLDPRPRRLLRAILAFLSALTFAHPGASLAQLEPDDLINEVPEAVNELPLVVYTMRFEKEGESVNFRPFIGGFFVAPAAGGQGTMILRATSDGVTGYRVLQNFGELFVSRERGTVRTVLRAGRDTDTETSAYVAFGEVDETLRVETPTVRAEVEVARVLRGMMVIADSERDLPFAGFQLDSGSVGFADLTLRLDPRTRQWNRDLKTRDEVVAEILENLERRGDINFAAGQGGGGQGGGGQGGGGQGGVTLPGGLPNRLPNSLQGN